MVLCDDYNTAAPHVAAITAGPTAAPKAAPSAPAAAASTRIDVEVDASPFLARSVSAVDSGYNGHQYDAGDDDDDTSSCCSNSSGSGSSYGGSAASEGGAKDLVHAASDLAAPMCIDGGVVVKNSTNVQFGNNTYYHGPVTLLVNNTKSIKGVPAPASPCADGELVLSAGDLADDSPPPAFAPPETPAAHGTPTKTRDKESLTRLSPICKWRFVAFVVAAMTALVVIVVLCVSLTDTAPPKVAPARLPNGLTIVQRSQWVAQPPKDGVDKLTASPVDYVIVHHSATDPCYSFAECVKMTRFIQQFHMESQNWSDIAYNFLVGGDGYAYVGRGWDKAGAHTYNWNARSMGVCLIGTFSYQRPTMEQLRTVEKLVQYGIQLNKVVAEYKLAGVCQLRSTSSPGTNVFSEIKKWSHWWNYTEGDSNCN